MDNNSNTNPDTFTSTTNTNFTEPATQLNEKFNKRSKLIIALSGIGLLFFLSAAVIFPFRDKLFGQLYMKPKSFASGNQATIRPEISLGLAGENQGELQAGSKLRLQVLARSDTLAANLFAAKLKFPVEFLKVEEIDIKKGQSFIERWAETNFDNTSGKISVVGGVASPGFKTTEASGSALMFEVVFTVRQDGMGTVLFDEDSAIFSNSDNTNILNTRKNLTFQTKSVESFTNQPLSTENIEFKAPKSEEALNLYPTLTTAITPTLEPTPTTTEESPTPTTEAENGEQI